MNLIKNYWFGICIGLVFAFFAFLITMIILSPKQDVQNRGFVYCTQNLIEELSFCDKKIGCSVKAIAENTWCDIKVVTTGFMDWKNDKQPLPWSNYIFEPELPIDRYVDEEEYKIYMEQNPNTKNEMNELEIFRKELENEQNNQIFDEKFLPKEE